MKILGPRDHRGERPEMYPEKVFLGNCMGVALDRRGENDPHVCFNILVEDDETWFVSSGSRISSFWMPELIEQTKAAQQWMEENCDKDGQFGYKFRT